MKRLEKAILSTLAYADVFDYPLRKEEIWQWLITEETGENSGQDRQKSVEKEEFLIVLDQLVKTKKCTRFKDFYFLLDKSVLISFRYKREKYSWLKLEKAKKAAGLLRLVPWVTMVGVTGALALLNSKKDDDIDILIVSRRDRIWLTRLFSVLLLELTGQRRQPEERVPKDKICLNMFLDEDHLAVPKDEQDLFTAHEVCQLKVLWDKNTTYKKFLGANQWVKKSLVNGVDRKKQRERNEPLIKTSGIFTQTLIVVCNFFLNFLNVDFVESSTKRLQLWYMKKRRTTEKIKKGIIRFHPNDARDWIIKEYTRRKMEIWKEEPFLRKVS